MKKIIQFELNLTVALIGSCGFKQLDDLDFGTLLVTTFHVEVPSETPPGNSNFSHLGSSKGTEMDKRCGGLTCGMAGNLFQTLMPSFPSRLLKIKLQSTPEIEGRIR